MISLTIAAEIRTTILDYLTTLNFWDRDLERHPVFKNPGESYETCLRRVAGAWFGELNLTPAVLRR
jgi:hypothetical protein